MKTLRPVRAALIKLRNQADITTAEQRNQTEPREKLTILSRHCLSVFVFNFLLLTRCSWYFWELCDDNTSG